MVIQVHAGEERFCLIDFGPGAIGMTAQFQKFSVVSPRLISISRRFPLNCRRPGRAGRAIKSIEAIGCTAKRGFEFLQGRYRLLKLQQ